MDEPFSPSPGEETTRALIATLQEQVRTLQRENAALRQQLDVLCQRMFGKRSERVDPRQFQLALEQLANEPGPVNERIEMALGRDAGPRPDAPAAHRPTALACTSAAPSRRDRCARGPRSSARAGIPRRASANRSPRSWSTSPRASSSSTRCARSTRVRTVTTAWWKRRRRRRPWRNRSPPKAHVVVTKYVDHTPLHRLSGTFAREGIDLPRSTLCDWVADVATVLAPIGDQLRREIVATDYLQTDDTTMTVLDERGGSYKGRLWTDLDR